jgi:23S rRNA (cytidine1920-2'-O)/16S rRNA (cytidine1409-2'-O)-methyltransferase
MAGRVSSSGVRVDKPGSRLAVDAPLEVRPGPRYVSRGGEKLAGAVSVLDRPPTDRSALDVGASTGGFTQVLLENGVRRIVALDVGKGQLDWTLRNDPRVIPLEGINARYLERSALPFVPDLVVMDVSFISVVQVLPAVMRCATDDAEALVLVKPQFEVGKGQVGRGGIVREREKHREVLGRVAVFALDHGWPVLHVLRSPIPGAEGNVEFFLHLRPGLPGLTVASLGRAIDAAVWPDRPEEQR